VPSLVDEDGFLYASPPELFAHKPKIEEIEAEPSSQKGVNVGYLDVQYVSPSQYPGLSSVIAKIAAENNVVSESMGEQRFPGVFATPIDQKLKAALQMLDALKPGLYLWVCHVGIDSPEQRALNLTLQGNKFLDGGVGLHSAAELNNLLSQEVKQMILKKGIILTNYRTVEGKPLIP
jgi:hypothetical protein